MLLPRALAVLLLAGAVAGCGGSDGGGDGNAAATTTTTSAPAPTGEAVDCAAGDGTTVTVEIPDFTFEPDPVEVGVCDDVVWSNVHDQAHTSSGAGSPGWSTGSIASGAQSDPVTFDSPGDYTYMCAFHPFMQGTVTVT